MLQIGFETITPILLDDVRIALKLALLITATHLAETNLVLDRRQRHSGRNYLTVRTPSSGSIGAMETDKSLGPQTGNLYDYRDQCSRLGLCTILHITMQN